jgi:hypothetical protein
VGRVSNAIVFCTALLAAGSAAIDMSDLRDGAAAMACCAKTDYSCAGMQAPDDCCRHMGHAAAHQMPATIDKNQPLPSTMAVPTAVAPHMVASLLLVVRVPTSFARPHDPPHLHPFAILI